MQSNSVVVVAETVHHFITAMDSLELNMVAVDRVTDLSKTAVKQVVSCCCKITIPLHGGIRHSRFTCCCCAMQNHLVLNNLAQSMSKVHQSLSFH